MRLVAKKLIADCFKGFRHFEADLPYMCNISGVNGSGKTTIKDAHFYLWTDKDSLLHSNPNIRPDFMEESEPSVTEIIEIDGKEIIVRKYQADGRTKKQKEAGEPVRIVNKFEVNDVPKSQKDFIKDLTALGVDFDRFLLLSHTDEFIDRKSSDCRNILFGMTDSITDAEIAKQAGCAELEAQLENRTLEEIAAMAKRSKKDADIQLDVIPNQITGLELAKVEVDVDSLTAERDKLTEVINQTEEFIRQNPIPDESEYRREIARLEADLNRLSREANADLTRKKSAVSAEISSLEAEKYKAQIKLDKLKTAVADYTDELRHIDEEYKASKQRFDEEKVKIFPIERDYCPTCYQPLPEEQRQEVRQKWEDAKTEKLREINIAAGNMIKASKTVKESIKNSTTDMKAANKAVIEIENRLDEKIKELDDLNNTKAVDASETEEFKAIASRIPEIAEKMKNIDVLRAERSNLLADLSQNKRNRDNVIEHLASAKQNDRIDAQIASLQEQIASYREKAAMANMLLDQIQTVSMQKNHVLEDQVNSHFTRVKFRLFNILKNGEIKDDCTPLILTGDGKYREITSSANTAAVELAKLDILNGLQNFYEQHLPIFLDGMECLDAENMKQIKADTQVISLRVSEDRKLVIS